MKSLLIAGLVYCVSLLIAGIAFCFSPFRVQLLGSKFRVAVLAEVVIGFCADPPKETHRSKRQQDERHFRLPRLQWPVVIVAMQRAHRLCRYTYLTSVGLPSRPHWSQVQPNL